MSKPAGHGGLPLEKFAHMKDLGQPLFNTSVCTKDDAPGRLYGGRAGVGGGGQNANYNTVYNVDIDISGDVHGLCHMYLISLLGYYYYYYGSGVSK